MQLVQGISSIANNFNKIRYLYNKNKYYNLIFMVDCYSGDISYLGMIWFRCVKESSYL